MVAVIEEFLAKHLGGRYQPGAPAEVAERIEALLVVTATTVGSETTLVSKGRSDETRRTISTVTGDSYAATGRRLFDECLLRGARNATIFCDLDGPWGGAA